MRLTEHFSFEELCISDTAVRLGIDNTPSAFAATNLRSLADGLEQVRRVLGYPVIVRSAFRCEELERVLTAKDFAAWCVRHNRNPEHAWNDYFGRKAHPQGYAADFICPAFGTPAEVVRILKKSSIEFDQLIEEGGAFGWVHVSFDPRMRGQVLTATFDKEGKPTYKEQTA